MKETESVQFEELCVWNFDKLKTKMIPDKNLRKQVEEILATNQINGKPIKDIGVVSFSKTAMFKPLNEKQLKKVEEFKRILFLVATSKLNTHNQSYTFLTSENFLLFCQNFQIDKRYTGYKAGKIVQNTSGESNNINYEMPKYILKNSFSCDKHLFQVLKKLKRRKKRVFNVIVRATGALMNGYKNSDDVSDESRILELTRAFEILFELSECNQRKAFKDKIRKYCVQKGKKKDRKWQYKSKRSNGRWEFETDYQQVIWADRFYILRNDIIHGSVIKHKDFSFKSHIHIHLALWFFHLSVKEIINEALECRSEEGEELECKLFYDTIHYDKREFHYHQNFACIALDKAFRRFKIISKSQWNKLSRCTSKNA